MNKEKKRIDLIDSIIILKNLKEESKTKEYKNYIHKIQKELVKKYIEFI